MFISASSALLNWALALRDRARLRPPASVERLRLTQEARKLLRDAVRRDVNNMEARGALVLCEAEIEKLKELVRRAAESEQRSKDVKRVQRNFNDQYW